MHVPKTVYRNRLIRLCEWIFGGKAFSSEANADLTEFRPP